MSKARTGADFAAKHVRSTSVETKIKAVLDKMKAIGPEHWEYETDLTKPPYGVGSRDLADYRDRFAGYWVLTEVQDGEKPRRVWFGDPKVAARYRMKETS